MKYVPKQPEGNVNVSEQNPLREFFVLLGGVLGFLVAVYFVLGWMVDLVAPRISPELEKKLGVLISNSYLPEQEDSSSSDYLNTVLARLADDRCFSYTLPVQVHYSSSEVVNAFALPGGHIVINRGLLEKLKSENELAFVLGHELGHFRNRDHLRSLGRGLIFAALSTLVLGTDNSLSGFISGSMEVSSLSFSRRQERAADAFGLNVLQCAYGQAGGSTAFFEHLDDQSQNLARRYLASHPTSPDRVRLLKQLIREKNFAIDTTALIPLPPWGE